MNTLFQNIENLCQLALNGKLTVEAAEAQINDFIRDANAFDTFLGGFIMGNIADALIFFTPEKED